MKTVLVFLKSLHENEGGFLQFLLPLAASFIIGSMQQNRQNQARAEIEGAEEALIPGEESELREQLALRGIGQTSAAANQIGQPRQRFETSKRVARARDLLSQPVVDPWMTAMQALAGGISNRLGSPQQRYPQPPRFGGGGSFY